MSADDRELKQLSRCYAVSQCCRKQSL